MRNLSGGRVCFGRPASEAEATLEASLGARLDTGRSERLASASGNERLGAGPILACVLLLLLLLFLLVLFWTNSEQWQASEKEREREKYFAPTFFCSFEEGDFSSTWAPLRSRGGSKSIGEERKRARGEIFIQTRVLFALLAQRARPCKVEAANIQSGA